MERDPRPVNEKASPGIEPPAPTILYAKSNTTAKPAVPIVCYLLADLRFDQGMAHAGAASGVVLYSAKAGEYAATTVPKILDYPPFTPTAARMTAAAIELLKRTMS